MKRTYDKSLIRTDYKAGQAFTTPTSDDVFCLLEDYDPEKDSIAIYIINGRGDRLRSEQISYEFLDAQCNLEEAV